MENSENTQRQEGRLKRSLGFWSLVFFGLIFMSPYAAFNYLNLTERWTNGFSHLGYALAAIFIICTVLSYQKMVCEFPEAGSAYTYASKGINNKVGFFIGWVLTYAYLLIPVFVLKLIATFVNAAYPQFPIWMIVIVFGLFVGVCACVGVKLSVTIQIIIGCIMILLVIVNDAEAVKATIEMGNPIINPDALFNSEMVNWGGVLQTCALAIVMFTGFDGITTLSEETIISPKKMSYTLMVAVIAQTLCLVISAYLVANASDWTRIPEDNVFIIYLMSIWTSSIFADVTNTILKVAELALVIAAVTSCSRILYAMGRDGVISKRIFGHISPRFNTPVSNIIMVSVISIVGALLFEYGIVAVTVSFGCSIAFCSVNIAVINYFWIKKKEKKVFRNLIFPIVGTCGIFYALLNAGSSCLILGCIWTAIGVIVYIVQSKRSQEFRDSMEKGIEGI